LKKAGGTQRGKKGNEPTKKNIPPKKKPERGAVTRLDYIKGGNLTGWEKGGPQKKHMNKTTGPKAGST